jgi:hypothetical protein
MDTTETAAKLGTTPRILRQFLRSTYSTFVAVGSGSRYDFTDSDLPMLTRRFDEWKSGARVTKRKPRGSKATTPVTTATPSTAPRLPSKRDRTVWEEEGEVIIEDIRRPEIRARIKRDAQRAEDRLMMILMSKGLHISQLGDRKATA